MGAILAFWLAGWGGPPPLVPYRYFIAGKRVSYFLAGPPV